MAICISDNWQKHVQSQTKADCTKVGMILILVTSGANVFHQISGHLQRQFLFWKICITTWDWLTPPLLDNWVPGPNCPGHSYPVPKQANKKLVFELPPTPYISPGESVIQEFSGCYVDVG